MKEMSLLCSVCGKSIGADEPVKWDGELACHLFVSRCVYLSNFSDHVGNTEPASYARLEALVSELISELKRIE